MYSIGGFLVFSGFSYRDAGRICTCSGRPVVEKILLPMTKCERDEYKDLIDSIRESYSIPSFLHYLYECVKFSPGLLGLWLEAIINSKISAKPGIPEPIAYKDICPFLLTIKECVMKQNQYFSSYWKQCFDPVHKNIDCLPCLLEYEKDGNSL